jgi:cytidylate kinase
MNNFVLSIGRQFGSGGSEIGKRFAEDMKVHYYDKELLAVAAKESGLCPEIFEKADECSKRRFAHIFSMSLMPFDSYLPYDDLLSNEKLFKLQSDAIRKIAENESCVIIGRCSDYVLRDNPRCLSVFIHNRLENRVALISQRLNINEIQAKELITKTDKSRAAYYNYYTNKTWGASASYMLSIDVSVIGMDETVALLKDLALRKFNTL